MNNFFKIDLDKNRVFGLDVVRAVAIMSVVIGHGSYLLPEKLGAISGFFVVGGVSMFFVLSGFLIGGILIKLIDKNGFNIHILKGFWIRRWFRTLPNYFLILTLLCIVHLLFDDGFKLKVAYKYFIFSQNLYEPHPYFFTEAWSLAVEEWFYLIFPLLILVASFFYVSHKKSILHIALLIIILTTAFRLYRFLNTEVNGFDDWNSLFREQVITRLDSLMFGVVGAYISYFHKSLWVGFKKQLLFAGILLFIVSKLLLSGFAAVDSLYSCVFSFTVVSIGTLLALPYFSQLKTGGGIFYKPITYISLISYSMYLVNLSVIQGWIIPIIPWERITKNEYIIRISNYSIYWIFVIGLSIIIYKYFEVPTTSLRERYSK